MPVPGPYFTDRFRLPPLPAYSAGIYSLTHGFLTGEGKIESDTT